MPPPPPPLTGVSRLSDPSSSRSFLEALKNYATSTPLLPASVLLLLVLASFVRCALLLRLRKSKQTRSCQAPAEKGPAPVIFKPIYPWISPPQPLPGPYEPRLYPHPTLRRHSYPDPSPPPPPETSSISYTRRVSTNSIPTRQTVLHGTVTTASNGAVGWRRNQWVVEAG